MSLRMQALTATASIAIVVGMSGGAAHADDGSVYAELARLNPGTTAAEMRASARADAAVSGGTAHDAAAEALTEARAHAGELGVSRSGHRLASSGGGGGGGKKPLPRAVLGDIYWWDSLTDHVGLYSNGTQIVQAPGTGKRVEVVPADSVQAPRHTEFMLVNTTSKGKARIGAKARQKAVVWAKSKKGKPYNRNFAFNKKINASKYNCSQLVWAAWKATANIDLDNGPGKGVYPGDIREDGRTRTYRKSI